MKHYTQAEIAALRAARPGDALVELIDTDTVQILAIPMPKAVLDVPITTMPGMTLELLDGASITLRSAA